MPQRQKEFNPDLINDLYARISKLEAQLRLGNKSPSVIERINPLTLPDPVEGQVAIDARTNCLIRYANERWRDMCHAVHAIKVNGDAKTNAVLSGAFKFSIESDLDGFDVIGASAFNGTAGTGLTSVQIQNVTRGVNLLNAVVSIPSGQYASAGEMDDADINDGGDVDDPNNRVYHKDRIWINVTAVGTGSKGLGVYMMFRQK